MTNKIRTFGSGATRDTVEGKLSYVKILSPIALRRYVEYMNFHAKQSDGTMREPDNWKSGFPIETYLDSLGRHLVAVWLLQQGFTETDNHGSVTLEDSLCGIIFNAMGWLHELLKKKTTTEFVVPDGWRIACVVENGWWVARTTESGNYLQKNNQLHNSTGGGTTDRYEYAQSPGYWPTEQEAEAALAAYLEKTK